MYPQSLVGRWPAPRTPSCIADVPTSVTACSSRSTSTLPPVRVRPSPLGWDHRAQVAAAARTQRCRRSGGPVGDRRSGSRRRGGTVDRLGPRRAPLCSARCLTGSRCAAHGGEVEGEAPHRVLLLISRVHILTFGVLRACAVSVPHLLCGQFRHALQRVHRGVRGCSPAPPRSARGKDRLGTSARQKPTRGHRTATRAVNRNC